MDDTNIFDRIKNYSPAKQALLKKMLLKKKLENSTVEASIPKRKDLFSFPLSFAQERLWFLHKFSPNKSMYNMAGYAKVTGPMDIPLVEASFNFVINRHDVLRTRFSEDNGVPAAEIINDFKITLEKNDLRNKAEKNDNTYITSLLTKEAEKPFDLSTAPPIRFILFQLEDQSFIVLVVIHHIVSDGFSTNILFKESISYYNSKKENKELSMPDLSIQYADYAVWQKKRFRQEVLKNQMEYWKNRLNGCEQILRLPLDFPIESMLTNEGDRIPFTINKERTEKIKTESKNQGVTPFMFLLTAFKILLYRFTYQEDIIVGIPVFGRHNTETQSLIGCFINVLPIRSHITGEYSFSRLLLEIKKDTVEAYQNQDIPFEKLIDELHVKRDMSHSPLCQVTFSYEESPIKDISMSGVAIHFSEISTNTSRVELELELTEENDILTGWFNFCTHSFKKSSIQRMIEHFINIIDSVLKNPEVQIKEIHFLTNFEKDLFFSKNKDRYQFYPPGKCIHQVFEEQAQKNPHHHALVSGDRTMNYEELNKKANMLAHHLKKLGTGPEVKVAVFCPRSIEMIIGVLGILKAGGCYVPIDISNPVERIKYILNDVQADIILTTGNNLDSIEFDGRIIVLDTGWNEIEKYDSDNTTNDDLTPQNTAYIIYTSGSTGKPKGVMVSHYNVIRLFESTQQWFHFTDKDVWTLFHSLAFDFSVWEIWGALFYSGKLVIIPYWAARSLDKFYKILVDEKVTVLNQTPSAFKHLSALEETEMYDHSSLSLRYIVFGGEALDFASLASWVKRHGDNYPQLINMYGITETTVHVTYRRVTEKDINESKGSLIGIPLPDLTLYLLDIYNHHVPVGVAGEICVGGSGVARGYLNRPELTDQKFVKNVFETDTHSRLYKSGDSARYLENGDVEYLGRIDLQVKIRGYRIELGEIENVLLRYPMVRECVVMVHVDEIKGNYLVAYIIPQNTETIDSSDVRTFIAGQLPEYMIPSFFLTLEQFPLTINNKIDRKKLPVPTVEEPGEEYVGPRNKIEEVITAVWCEVLELEKIGVRNNFFEQGGHSLLATQVMSRIRRIFHLDIPLYNLFQSPTIESIAKILQSKETEAGQMEEIAALYQKICMMSDDELKQFMSEK
ncbi:MAG: amino acid adenylation domain-containing protein [Spirochaetales bacterium]|nr:amino acid adenylation domain-containing protein [Spirochaetales bacterium]